MEHCVIRAQCPSRESLYSVSSVEGRDRCLVKHLTPNLENAHSDSESEEGCRTSIWSVLRLLTTDKKRGSILKN